MVQVSLKQYVYQQWAISRLLNKHWKISFPSSTPPFSVSYIFFKDSFFSASQFSTLSPIHFSPKRNLMKKSWHFLDHTQSNKKKKIFIILETSHFHQQMEVTQLPFSGPKFTTQVARTVSVLCHCMKYQRKNVQGSTLLLKLHIFSIALLFSDIF